MTQPERTLRVLAIDDEVFQLKLLMVQITQLGRTRVQPSRNARDALAILQEDPAAFDVITCDLQMPDMDGIEFVRHLAQTGFTGSLVLISGEDPRILQTAERLAQAHSLRLLGALHKPVTPEQLSVVMTAARSEAVVRQRVARPEYGADEVARAISERQLVNHYQPKVELATGQVIGVETLVRWQHPRDGLVYPDQFIAVAEQHGLIDNLTRAVLAGLTGALQQARRWQDSHWPLQVAVNVSMDNLVDHSLPDFIAREVAAAGVPPSRLVLEVTESRMMTDRLITLDVLTRLRLKRVGISIDDFGTGHSSLAQLREIPFDELKIDRSFVHGAAAQEGLRAIVLPTLDMARQLGIKTVAEGVEDEADWHFLRDCGCDLAQGYFIARPMPAEQMDDWRADWERRYPALMR